MILWKVRWFDRETPELVEVRWFSKKSEANKFVKPMVSSFTLCAFDVPYRRDELAEWLTEHRVDAQAD